MPPTHPHRFSWHQLLQEIALCVCFVGLLATDVLGIINSVTLSLPYVWVLGNAFIVGTLVWALALNDRKRGDAAQIERTDVPGSMAVGEFVAKVTMNSPEGKVMLWSSIANLCLAGVVLLARDRVPDAIWIASIAATSPLFLFLIHTQSFLYGRLESQWFRIVLLVGWASIPSAKLLNDLSIR